MKRRIDQPGRDDAVSALSGKLEAFATGLHDELRSLRGTDALRQAAQAAQLWRQVSATARQLSQALAKPLRLDALLPLRRSSACPGGVCPAPSGGGGGGTGGADGGGGAAGPSAGGSFGSALTSGLGAAMRAALSGDFTRALQSMLQSIVRSIASSVGRAAGGGVGGSLVSTLVGTGLSLLLGKLFHKRQAVQVENTVRAEVLNFPRLSSLDFAANPASRLFGARAVARGPAFAVEVSYRGGAEELVTAKVAQRLADLNLQQGIG
jgi:hypothetical protein